jgi:hypothetical protein
MTESDFIWGRYGEELVYLIDSSPTVAKIPDIMLYIQHRKKVSLAGIGIIHRHYNGKWDRVLHVKGKYAGEIPIATGSRTEKWKNEIEKTLVC